MIICHLIFLFSYFFYYYIFFKNTGQILYPVYLFPLIIYTIILLLSFYFKIIFKVNLKKIFNDFSKFLFIFILLFLTPFFLKVNIPQPHNFVLRKLEIFAGVTYIICLTAIIIYALNALKEKIKDKYNDKKFLFKNIFVIFFIFYFFISLWLNYVNQPTGDEPIYLLVSHSIVFDRDIDLKNNYENKDYKRFYLNRELKSQEIEIYGKLFSYHPFFYSLLISPFYFAGGRLGVTIFSNFLSALFIGFLFLLLFEISDNKKMVFLMTIFSGFSMPFIMYINQICTEVLNGLLILMSFYLILYNKNKLLFIVLCVALMPWTHFRNFIIWIFIILIFIIENRNETLKILKFVFVQIISIFSLFIFNYMHYKVLIPRQTKEEIAFFDAFKLRLDGMLGLFLDQEFGLFFYTPLFIFIFAGFYFLYKENRKIFYYMSMLFLPYYLFISSWTLWNGGGGASNRFLIPVFFIFVILIFSVFNNLKDKILKNIFYTGLILNFLFSFIIISIPWFRWNKGFGENWILKIISDIIKINISDLFPSLWYQPQNNIIQIIIWILLISFINIFIIIRNSRYE